jgi:two-component system response regulator AtoC
VVALVAPGAGDAGAARVAGLAALQAGAVDFCLAGDADALALALAKIEARRAASPSPSPSSPSSRGPGDLATTPRSSSNGSAAPASPAEGAARLVGSGARMAAVLAVVRKLAGIRSTVLVWGESGTGTELVARALHDLSPWHAGPFVAVNCAAIPGGLLESELFGHVRGAFTDAVRDKRGLFDEAAGGTLFLDEIADLPLALQSKLLRAVQDGQIRAVGDARDRRVDVRLVAATARDLGAEVRDGRFREDLYYRLAGLTVALPPLRERRDDIPALAEHFLRRARERHGRPSGGITAEAMALLQAHTWPGNVRELENTIDRAAVLCDGDEVDAASLPERLAPRPAAGPTAAALRGGVGAGATAAPGAPESGLESGSVDLSIKRASRRAEEDLIRRALAETRGNRTRAAALLEISHRALLYKIKEYGIAVDAPGGTRQDPAEARPEPPGRGPPVPRQRR